MIRQWTNINEMLFGFITVKNFRRFFYSKIKEKQLVKKKNLYCTFVDYKDVFDRGPRDDLWWALRKLVIEEWLVKILQTICRNALSDVRVNGIFSDAFLV